MQDKFEFGLKVLWDRDEIIHEIESEDEDIRRLKGRFRRRRARRRADAAWTAD
jgi:hypothetical protein